ncbi:MAG: NIPSNAP family protein [Cyclobacteriaceae bacterium]
MKRRKFVASSALAVGAVAAGTVSTAKANQEGQHIIEFREYTLKWGTSSSTLPNYFKEALIPALNKYGVKNVGVFEDNSQPSPMKLFLLISYPSFEGMQKIKEQVESDKDYIASSKSFSELPVEKQYFNRYTTVLMKAFSALPQVVPPQERNTLLELRSYEGFSDDAVRRKIMMFNDEEIALFDKCEMKSVFFGEVIAGPKMPRLTYMLSYKDMDDRKKVWGTFVNHPEWKVMSKDSKYANTVSNIERVFLKPTDISQI